MERNALSHRNGAPIARVCDSPGARVAVRSLRAPVRLGMLLWKGYGSTTLVDFGFRDVHDRLVSIVAVDPVAAGSAGPTGRCLLVVQRNPPLTKPHRFSDMRREIAGVWFVTRSAGSSFDLLVYMEVVKVPFTIAKFGRGVGFFLFHGLDVMAFETETVIVFGIGRVETGRVGRHE